MRAALWLMALFAIAVASALFAGNNHGTVTVYWPPYRVDLSLNLVLLLLALAFVTVYGAMRALSALLSLPKQARSWRLLQKERAIHAALLETLAHLFSGRFVRARHSAELVLALEESVERSGARVPSAGPLRALVHLLAGESAHVLQDRTVRDGHFQQALAEAARRDAAEVRDGVHLRAARWAIEDRDAGAALQWLDQLPQGAGRRTVALRLRFKAARLAGQAKVALDTVRLLTKHRAFSEAAGKSIARGLALEVLLAAHDSAQVQRAWETLEPAEQRMPEVAIAAAERLLAHGGEAVMARQWLLPAWEVMAKQGDAMALAQRVRLVQALNHSFGASDGAPDAVWLARIESAQMAHPRDAVLQYLAGVVCMRLALWGKAHQMLKQSLSLLSDSDLRRDAWLAMAQLAEQRNDVAAATAAYREAAKR